MKKEDEAIKDFFDGSERFESFVLLVDSAHKHISKIKQMISADSSIKSVHTLWLYILSKYNDGLTPTELAEKTNIDRSLVSREIRELVSEGYVDHSYPKGKRGYNTKITLTDKGRDLARQIAASALAVQSAVSQSISAEELKVFYTTLYKICKNLEGITEGQGQE